MKNGVFWDVTPCGSCKNRRFGGTWRLLHHGDKKSRFLQEPHGVTSQKAPFFIKPNLSKHNFRNFKLINFNSQKFHNTVKGLLIIFIIVAATFIITLAV
jgi:hypothetical protein